MRQNRELEKGPSRSFNLLKRSFGSKQSCSLPYHLPLSCLAAGKEWVGGGPASEDFDG